MTDVAVLLADAAAAAYMTKVVIDIVRMKVTSLDGIRIVFLAFVLGLAFSVAWTFYKEGIVDTPSDYAKVFIQGVLSAIGAIGATEAHKAARSDEREGLL